MKILLYVTIDNELKPIGYVDFVATPSYDSLSSEPQHRFTNFPDMRKYAFGEMNKMRERVSLPPLPLGLCHDWDFVVRPESTEEGVEQKSDVIQQWEFKQATSTTRSQTTTTTPTTTTGSGIGNGSKLLSSSSTKMSERVQVQPSRVSTSAALRPRVLKKTSIDKDNNKKAAGNTRNNNTNKQRGKKASKTPKDKENEGLWFFQRWWRGNNNESTSDSSDEDDDDDDDDANEDQDDDNNGKRSKTKPKPKGKEKLNTRHESRIRKPGVPASSSTRNKMRVKSAPQVVNERLVESAAQNGQQLDDDDGRDD